MAAGLGFKDFTTGEVLTAADVDGYLMQGIWVFASAAARDAAVTSPQEGNFAYLKDTNVTTYYTGSAWANVDTTGMTNPMTTTGDTIYSSSGSTPARLGIGSTGQVLTVAGGLPSWATPASAGGMTLINTGGTTLTGSSVTIGSIPGTYKNLQLIIRDFRPVTDGDGIKIRFNADSSANMHYYKNWYETTGTFAWNRSDIFLLNDVDNGASDGLIAVDFYDYANTTTFKMMRSQGFGADKTTNTSIVLFNFIGYYKSTNAVTSIEMFTDQGGGFTSGTAFLYGVS